MAFGEQRVLLVQDRMGNANLCWCGQTDLENFSPSYGRCPRCETLVLLKQPPEQHLGADDERDFYGHHYFEHLTNEYGYPERAARARADLPERCVHWLRTVLKYRHPPANVLEIGSAHGAFVALLSWTGFEATGLELSRKTAELAETEFGVPVLVGPLEEQDIPKSSIDTIVLMDVLEHLGDPSATIRHCVSLLREDGCLVIQTPNVPSGRTYDDLVASRDPFLEQLKEKEHLYLFSETGIVDFLSRAGCPHIAFEPAIFAHYDMFLVAGRAPLAEQSTWTADSPSARLVQALLDLRESHEDINRRLTVAEADRAARLDVIQDLSTRLAECDADRNERLAVIERLSAELEGLAGRSPSRWLLHQLHRAFRHRLDSSKKPRI